MEAELKDKIQQVYDNLMNLQPHIPQACYPKKVAFIDNYVNPCLEILNEILEEK